ncbi:class I glutamine amidotransferase-like protein [Mycena filopes]|nr:class I glutamine amidotransferase-like protein [Mycena filopes]
MQETLNIAVCLSDGVTLTDFITPVEILAGLNGGDRPGTDGVLLNLPYRVAFEYLAPTMDPVITYQPAGRQFDIIWVPAGPGPDYGTGVSHIPEDEIAFLRLQAPKAKYVLSVCTGAFQLALAGVLEGKRATTNKMFFKTIVAATSKNIEWVPKARWVVDGNVWTSSGATAGFDMALAFVEHLTNAKVARNLRGEFEIAEVTEGDDPFAAFHGLV